MNKIALNRFGWVVTAAIAAVWLGSGFRQGEVKMAVVDTYVLTHDSEVGKKAATQLAEMQKTREDLLQFFDTNPIATAEQAQQVHDLWLKPDRTAADTAKLESIKADVVAACKKQQELSVKNLTPEERTLMEDYARRSQSMSETMRRWFGEFQSELGNRREELLKGASDKATGAINQVAKAQGYTVVFSKNMAPYGANDLTDEALKTMNATP